MRLATTVTLALTMVASIHADAFPVVSNDTSVHDGAMLCLAPEWNIQYSNDDVSEPFPAKSYGDCCRACDANPLCGAYTWWYELGGTCTLKNSRQRSFHWSPLLGGPQYVSAEMYRCAPLLKDIAFEGEVLYTEQRSSSTKCCQTCYNMPLCRGFSWDGSICSFKGGDLNAMYAPGIQSAYQSKQ